MKHVNSQGFRHTSFSTVIIMSWKFWFHKPIEILALNIYLEFDLKLCSFYVRCCTVCLVSLLFVLYLLFFVMFIQLFFKFICCMFVFLLYMFCFFCVFSVFVLYCVMSLQMYIFVYYLFVYNFTDHCHRAKTQLQLINIISYQTCIWYKLGSSVSPVVRAQGSGYNS